MYSLLKATVIGGALLAGATAVCGQILSEHFNYPDGRLVGAAGSSWVVGNAGTTPLNVGSGAALINQADTVGNKEDAALALGTTFSKTGAQKTAFFSFDATWTALPTSVNGSYFAHLSSTPTSSTQDARVGADLEGAASGKFRIGIANATWTQGASVEFPQDLSLNTKYKVVVKYDLVASLATLWINPTSMGSTSVSAADAVASQADLTALGLRQGTSSSPTGAPGFIKVDNLLVGTSFAQVTPVPEPEEYAALFGTGLAFFALYRRRMAK